LSSLFFRAKWPQRDQWRGVAGGGGVASTRMQMFERRETALGSINLSISMEGCASSLGKLAPRFH
jgi:hypothetical protein